MKLQFTADIVLDVPDEVVAKVLGDNAIKSLDTLSIGDFGELVLTPGDDQTPKGATMVWYSTHEHVRRTD